jgi:type III secretion protein U
MSENKNLDPTDRKIDKSREDGQIAQSQDLSRLATLVAVAELAFMTESRWRESIHSFMDFSFYSVGKPFLPAVTEMLTGASLLLLIVFLIGFVLVSAVSVASHWGQFGVLIAPKALEPKFEKLNPVNGFKTIFSIKKLVELFETVIKASLIGLVVYLITHSELATIIHLAGGTPKDTYAAFIELLRKTFHIIVIMCLVLAFLDFAIQKHFHKKELMMDMEELKQELKEVEGDPLIKNERKQLARKWSSESPVATVEKSNALVVNPTHFAVAMFYDQEDAIVPIVLAKGKDEVAQAMIQRARDCGVPVIRHVWLARTLYATCKANTVIPKSSYESVAHVYAVIHYLLMTNQHDLEFELETLGEPPESYEQGRRE